MTARESVLAELMGEFRRFNQIGLRLRLPSVMATELTVPQLKVLMLAGVGPLTAQDVSETLGVSAATVSGLVARLVEHGMLVQETDPADRRSRLLRPTPAGEAALDELNSLHAEHQQAALAQMSDAELDGLLLGVRGLARGLLQHLEDQSAPPR